VVTGQRRTAGSSEPFPKDTWVSEPPLEGQDATIEPDENMSVEDQQCAIPKNRKVWDADARAAQAVKDLKTFAQSLGQSIFTTEFGANLRFDGTTTRLSNMRGGTTTGVLIDNNEVTDRNWMGDIHTHPAGDGRPSYGSATSDTVGFQDRLYAISQLQPPREDIDHLAMYIVVADANASAGYRIYSYTRTSDIHSLGREVDPDARPCS
jgi:hypothetical protein